MISHCNRTFLTPTEVDFIQEVVIWKIYKQGHLVFLIKGSPNTRPNKPL